MFGLKKLFSTSPSVRPARRPVPTRLQVESLEGRQLMSTTATFFHPVYSSTTSAVTTHPSSGVTNHDLYAIDSATKTVVDYHNGSQINLNQTTRFGGPQGVFTVSAGTDASGNAEVFALDGNEYLWRYRDNGYFKGWLQDGGGLQYAAISATRDGFVYASLDPHTNATADVYRINGEDMGKWNLGSPGSHGSFGVAASRDAYGYDTVYSLDAYGHIWNYDSHMSSYVTNSSGWSAVDTSRWFDSLSASQTGDVYATANGQLFQEHYTYIWNSSSYQLQNYWYVSQLGNGRHFQWNISADNSGVYAIESSTATAYRYDRNGKEAVKDYNVSEISGADDGYFFDVNPSYNGNSVWAFDPSSSWKYVGSNIV